jgi:hypothetical protein
LDQDEFKVYEKQIPKKVGKIEKFDEKVERSLIKNN